MILIDRFLMSGVRFVLGTLEAAADSEVNDASRLHDALMDAQMRHELGEIGDAELAAVEADVYARLRELRTREREQAGAEDVRITGVEIDIDGALDGP